MLAIFWWSLFVCFVTLAKCQTPVRFLRFELPNIVNSITVFQHWISNLKFSQNVFANRVYCSNDLGELSFSKFFFSEQLTRQWYVLRKKVVRKIPEIFDSVHAHLKAAEYRELVIGMTSSTVGDYLLALTASNSIQLGLGYKKPKSPSSASRTEIEKTGEPNFSELRYNPNIAGNDYWLRRAGIAILYFALELSWPIAFTKLPSSIFLATSSRSLFLSTWKPSSISVFGSPKSFWISNPNSCQSMSLVFKPQWRRLLRLFKT